MLVLNALGPLEIIALGSSIQMIQLKPGVQLNPFECRCIRWKMGGGIQPSRQEGLDTLQEAQHTILEDRCLAGQSNAEVRLEN